MASQSEKFLAASGQLQTLAYKYEIERNLRTRDYAGFQLLGLNDYSGQGTALVGPLNVHWREKQCLLPDGTMRPYVDGELWREFCSPIVPLARFSKFVYENTDTLVVPVELYNASGKSLADAHCIYIIQEDLQNETSHQEPLIKAKGTFEVKGKAIGKNTDLGVISIPLANLKTPAKYTLMVFITAADGTLTARNHWNFWVYPREVKREKVNDDKFYECDTLNQQALDVLANGGDVLITAAGKVRFGNDVVHRYLPVFWNTSWFKMRPPHTTGAYIQKDHPVFRDFPTDDWQNLNWWELMNGVQVMNLSEFPRDYQPIVQPIDTWHISRKLGVLVEARVLKGRVLMTTMDLTSNLDHRLVARQLRQSVLNYMQSDRFQPAFQIEPQIITNLFERTAPAVNMFTNESPDELKPALK